MGFLLLELRLRHILKSQLHKIHIHLSNFQIELTRKKNIQLSPKSLVLQLKQKKLSLKAVMTNVCGQHCLISNCKSYDS